VHIGLHKNLAKAERFLRSLGYGPKLDDMLRAMNRAAEQAMPKAEPILLNAARKLTLEDAKAILNGGPEAVTAWFRKGTETTLKEALQPVIHSVAEQSDLLRAHAALAKVLSRWNIGGDLGAVEEYVSHKALDGIYATVAEEERALRTNPLKYAGGLVGKVFELVK
jgi:predicted lipid-binding transport protein (Tim44 family)